ncbi:hypothetical protein [Sphingomonas jaspsi]|uniref:hypothetical protein n=1 Tax=Sphingomonas jaspsi TaxID=392409 RepID=UPI00055AB1E6|nr:hypothetical protein [Sphingomonas jaspsi]
MADTNNMPTYNQCFASLAAGLAPFCVLVGIAGFAGSNTVTWNGQYVHGAGALLVAAVLNLLFAAIFAGVQKLGYWILGRVRPRAQNG